MNRTGVTASILLLLVVLTGCSALRTGSSSYDHTRFQLDSVDGQVGSLRLLSVSIASPGTRGSIHIAGDSAALLLTVANDGEDEDVLTGASTDVAEGVVLRDGDAPSDPDLQVPVPSGSVAIVRDVTGPHLELSGLQERLRSGFSVPVTFEFRDAGSVTLSVPIRTYTDVRPDRFSISAQCRC
ncbi:copper chaperone PCu(A)C [Blastococcus xanthinilyticus]|uniref:Copper(I)-binding protein n=1 Tax=Blastococcus xanthinilyticus TaxID=1564164 RepID=A0A5S5CKF6_9ACTN|nr:copper chaperone PCu(A)C [Blastococcus xanthinilyticus]TYP81160.1 copper(I)-binding protein [Blastococcus xanthinilyticus]